MKINLPKVATACTIMALIVMTMAVATLDGCVSATLPKPNTAKTAGVEAVVIYALAAHAGNQYLALPVCTKPLTAVPCKTEEIANRLKLADENAFNAAIAADKAVNDPAAQQKAADSLQFLKDAQADAKKSSVATTIGAKQ